MPTFDQTRTCGSCDNRETRQLEKLTAAFLPANRWETPCGNCGGQQFSTLSLPMPKLDVEIMEAWIRDPDLYLMDQDEDLILASRENFELLKTFVVRDDACNDKRAVMLSALCVLVGECDEQDDPRTRDDVVQFLINNRHLFAEVGDDGIFEHVKRNVYPRIGLTPPTDSDE